MDDQTETPELFMFLASTAHDMKNSISVLSGTLETVLGAASPVDESGKTNLGEVYPQMAHMLYQTKRLNDNLMQLLALYKQVGKPEYPFDARPQQLEQMVEQVVSQVKVLLASKRIALEIECDPDLIWCYDEDLIIGVVGHAINNAIHYTGDRVRLAIGEVDGWLEVRVEDNGRGYPGAMIEAGATAMSGLARGVKFATNSTGLGLYFSSEVAKAHRHRGRVGSIALENGGAFGGGCFVLRLP